MKDAFLFLQNLAKEEYSAILPDPAVRRWMQKFMGYFLTGSTEKEKFLIAYEPDGCGKGTFFETIAAALGDYKSTIPIDSLLAGTYYTNGEGLTPELAKLAGKRYVLSRPLSETVKNAFPALFSPSNAFPHKKYMRANPGPVLIQTM